MKEKPATNSDFNINLISYCGGAFWQHNKDMCLVFGHELSMWLTYLIDWGAHMIEKKKLEEGDLFYCDQKNIMWKTGISLDKQTQFIKELTGLGILKVERRNIPPKNYYGINMESLINLIAELKEIDVELEKENNAIRKENKMVKREDRVRKETSKQYLIKFIMDREIEKQKQEKTQQKQGKLFKK